jgi:hypothetical protein
MGTEPTSALIYALFDLIRNGQAHQYQSTLVTLQDGQGLHIRVTGAAFGATLAVSGATARKEHLRIGRDAQGDVWIDVRTDLLFLDIASSVGALSLPSRSMQRLSAPASGKPHYRYDSSELLRAFREAGHTVVSLDAPNPVPTLAPQLYLDALKPR